MSKKKNFVTVCVEFPVYFILNQSTVKNKTKINKTQFN